MAGIGYRAASLSLPDSGGLLMRPAVTLAYVTLVQSVLLTGWLWLRGEGRVGAVLKEWRIEALVGAAGMLASLGWFTAFTLATVAEVKAVGQVELVFSWLTARFAFGERPSGRETVAIGLVAGGSCWWFWDSLRGRSVSRASGGGHPFGTARKIRAGRRLESGWNPACHFFTGC